MADESELTPGVSGWEQAEIERSAQEASRRHADALRIHNIDRYQDPPASTAFPLEYAFHLLGDVRGKIVLDLGCGAGENSLLLATRGAQVTALDISPELVELARRRFEVMGISTEHVRFMVGSAYETTLADDSVDVVFGIGILHHLDLEKSQKEVFRVLRKGGVAIFQEPVRDSKSIRFLRRLVPYETPDVSPFERPLRSEELRSFAEPFTRVQGRSFYLPHLPFVKWLFPKAISAAYRWDRKILAALPLLSRYAGVRVVKLRK